MLVIARYFRQTPDMAQRSITADQESWDRVAQAVRERRSALGERSVDEVIARSKTYVAKGVSRSVVSLIENARQASYALRSLRALSVGLDWTPNSIELVLEGREPQEPDDVRRVWDQILALQPDIVEHATKVADMFTGQATPEELQLMYPVLVQALATRIRVDRVMAQLADHPSVQHALAGSDMDVLNLMVKHQFTIDDLPDDPQLALDVEREVARQDTETAAELADQSADAEIAPVSGIYETKTGRYVPRAGGQELPRAAGTRAGVTDPRVAGAPISSRPHPEPERGEP